MANRKNSCPELITAVVDDLIEFYDLDPKKLAQIIDYDYYTVVHLLNKTRPATEKILNAIADKLHCTFEDLTVPDTYTYKCKGRRAAGKAPRGCFPVDPDRFKGLCAARGFTPASLASRKGIGAANVERAGRGGYVEAEPFKEIVEALQPPFGAAYLMPISPASVNPGTHKTFIDPLDFEWVFPDPESTKDLMARLATYLAFSQANANYQIVKSYKGNSIHIVIRMEREDVVRLKAAYDNGELSHLGLLGMRILPNRRWDYLALACGVSGILCCLIAPFDTFRMPTLIAALLLGCGGISFLGRSIYVRLKG